MLCITVLGSLGPMNSFYASSSRILLLWPEKTTACSLQPSDHSQAIAKSTHILLSTSIVLAPFLGSNMLLPLTNVAALTFMFSCMMVSLACYKMRSSEANLYRPYKSLAAKRVSVLHAASVFSLLLPCCCPGTSASLSKTEYLVLTGWTALGLLVKSLHLYKK